METFVIVVLCLGFVAMLAALITIAVHVFLSMDGKLADKKYARAVLVVNQDYDIAKNGIKEKKFRIKINEKEFKKNFMIYATRNTVEELEVKLQTVVEYISQYKALQDEKKANKKAVKSARKSSDIPVYSTKGKTIEENNTSKRSKKETE